MREAIQLALGYVLGEAPWYLLACVPFMGRRRVSKRGIYLMALFMMAFRAATAFVLVLGVPDWRSWAALAYVPYYILLVALFLCAFRASPARLFYVFLLIYAISTCVNQVTLVILQLLFPQRQIAMSTFPLLTAFMLAVFLALLPFLYRFMKGSLRQAVEELDTRSILLLCVSPLLFDAAALAFLGYANNFAVKDLPLLTLYLLLTLAGVVSYFVNLRLLLGSAQRLRSEHELETRLAVQAQGYKELTQRNEAARAARHDLRHHLSVVRDFAARDDKAGLLRYLDEYDKSLSADDGPDWCENQVVNALLRHYLAPAQQAGVALDVKLDIPVHAGAPDTDLCVVFGNIFENAARSAAAAGQGAYIRARCESGGADIVLTVENSVGQAAHGEGRGLRSVEMTAKRHGGAARFEQKGGVFYSRVLLQKSTPPVGG